MCLGCVVGSTEVVEESDFPSRHTVMEPVGSGRLPREKMVYMAVKDANQEDDLSAFCRAFTLQIVKICVILINRLILYYSFIFIFHFFMFHIVHTLPWFKSKSRLLIKFFFIQG